MPSLARPLALLLALPLAWLLWHWHRRRFAALRFSGLALVRGLPHGRTRWARIGPLMLWALGLGLLLLSFAGPRVPDPGSRVPTEGISIALVVDASESMSFKAFSQGGASVTRWEVVKKVVKRFIKGGEEGGLSLPGRPNDLIALVTFAERPETDCPPTLDHEVILGLLEEEHPRKVEGTNPGDALAWALHLLARAPTRRKVIILLTDGEDNVLTKFVPPLQAAKMAAHLEVPIYAVEVEPLPEESPPEEQVKARALMQDLAKISSGLFFTARDPEGLAQAYAAIDQLERDRIESFQYRRHVEIDIWLAAAALGVILMLVTLQATRWRSAP